VVDLQCCFSDRFSVDAAPFSHADVPPGGYARNFGQRLGGSIRRRKGAGGGGAHLDARGQRRGIVCRVPRHGGRARAPSGARFFLTTTTSTGYALAKKQVAGSDVLAYFPVDFPFIMRRIFDRVRRSR
jgi:hypothetical protein